MRPEDKTLIPGCDMYEVYKDGRVFSKHNNMFLRKHTSDQGYEYVGFSYKNKKKVRMSVHRLLATTFIPNPENKPEVNHINGIKNDNRLENLEWVTRSENAKHAFRTGLNRISKDHREAISKRAKMNTGRKNNAARKVIDIVTGEVFDTISSASEKAGMKLTTLSVMLSGQNPNKTNYRYHETTTRR